MKRKFLTILIIMSTVMFLNVNCDDGYDENPVSEEFILTAQEMTTTTDSFEPMLNTLRADYITLETSNTVMKKMNVEPIGMYAEELIIPQSVLHIKQIKMTHAIGDKKGEVVHIYVGQSVVNVAAYLYLVGSTDTFIDVKITLVALDMPGTATGTGLNINLCDRLLIDDPGDKVVMGDPGFLWQTSDVGFGLQTDLMPGRSDCSQDFPEGVCPVDDPDNPWMCAIVSYTNPALEHIVKDNGYITFDNVLQQVTAQDGVVLGDYKYTGNFKMTASNVLFNGPSIFELYKLDCTTLVNGQPTPLDFYGWEMFMLSLIQADILDSEFGIYTVNSATFEFVDYEMMSPSAEKLGITF